MKKTPLVSIIVPVYNVEEYLPHCLDSLVDQTYKNIEIICVNDGSTDNSLDILKKYSDKDRRIKIINKKNEGVSAARNDALSIASGDYILFTDADDSTDIKTCEIAVLQAMKNSCDVVMWGYISEGNGRSDKKSVFDKTILFQGEEVSRKIHRRFFGLLNEELAHPELGDSLSPVWGKLYDAKLIKDNGINFVSLEEIGTYEDGLFNIQVFKHVNKAKYLNEYLYHYRRDNNDSQTSRYRDDLKDKWFRLFDLMENQIKSDKLGSEFESALKNRIALSILGLGLNILSSEFSAKEKRRLLKNIVISDRYQAACGDLVFSYFPIHWKLFYFCAKHRLVLGLYLLLKAIKRIIS